MKHILLTLEAGSQEEKALLADTSKVEIESRSPPEKEETIVISGSLSIAP